MMMSVAGESVKETKPGHVLTLSFPAEGGAPMVCFVTPPTMAV